jgi:diadenylate cyclase
MLEILKIGFLNLTVIDLIDIGIVAVLIFWLYRALRGTIAVQILVGLVVIIGLSFITEAINLRALNWILRTISDIWLLAFIILFQPELRRLLLMITRNPFFKFFVKSKYSETIREAVDAIIELSEKHVGALLVFTRTQNVEMTVDTGIPLQSVVSQELLVSIFNTKSPLHDGAVIIEDQLIIAARCVLPLSSVTKYEGRNLGTRHRAGLGLSEQVDAVVIIVSEETGSISFADSGELTLNIPKDKISSFLRSKLSEKAK